MNIHDVLLKLLIKEPFYGHIASKLLIKESSKEKKLIIRTYPQMVLSYNPIWFNTLTDEVKYGYLLHELLHIILQHPNRRGSRSKDLWAVSSDIVVNQYIDDIYKDNNWIDIEIIAKEFNIKIQYYQSSEYYYDILKKIKMDVRGSISSSEAMITLSGNKEYRSDYIIEPENQAEDLSLLKTVVGESIASKGSNIKVLQTLYSDYIINWRVVLKRFLSNRGRRDKKKSYKKISRRFDQYPGHIYTKGVEALIALDESGSMPDELIEIYIKELIEINKITGVKIQIVRFDSECSEPVPLKQYIKEKGRLKRGMTDFTPIFNVADNLKIPLVVIFTDGKGSCPEYVNQKVLWLLTNDGEKPANFGEVINFT